VGTIGRDLKTTFKSDLGGARVETRERDTRLEELFATGWTTELFAQFWAAPDLKYIPSIITDDVVGYWPGGRTVRGKAEYMQALEDLLTLLPDLRLEVPEHTMSADGEFGFSRGVMHATGAKAISGVFPPTGKFSFGSLNAVLEVTHVLESQLPEDDSRSN